MSVTHETYAMKLLSSLMDSEPQIEALNFQPDRTQSRNAAKAMTIILCNRLHKASGQQPKPEKNTTYVWEDGLFNCRNIADRGDLWSNMRRSVADAIHERAAKEPVVYLMAFSSPTDDATINVWAIPEPVLHKSLSNLPVKEGGQEYTLQIFTNKQRIDRDAASPDLLPFFRRFELLPQELVLLRQSRNADAFVRTNRKAKDGGEASEIQGEAVFTVGADNAASRAEEVDSISIAEGRELLRVHRIRERKRRLVASKKRRI